MNIIESKNGIKDIYEKPAFELIEFNSYEIITTSLNVKDNDESNSDIYEW